MTDRPLILPVFLPHLGCRQRCLFCNQRAVAPAPMDPGAAARFVETAVSMIPSSRRNRIKQVGFYGGSFTAMPQEDQVRYLKEVRPFLESGTIDSIRVSTRPDALDNEIVSLLKDYGVRTVEVGAQSMADHVLCLSHRGHRAEDTVASVLRLREQGLEAGLHLMMGLPGDSQALFLRSVDSVIDLRPDFVRIHPTLVLRGALLETFWRRKAYVPLSLDECIQWLKMGLHRLERASIPVVRIGLQPDKELEKHVLAGPYHPALHQMVDAAIAHDLAVHLLRKHPGLTEATFGCHPKEISNLRGQMNKNLLKLKDRFFLRKISVRKNESVMTGSLHLETTEGNVSIHRQELYSLQTPDLPPAAVSERKSAAEGQGV